ncbi:MAG: Gfo/Idh/MocA family oxidoreductase [Clostridia bacterium]|nr:Gfo/Idh/MocA family oxidoreductase [Clostridia bacterium]
MTFSIIGAGNCFKLWDNAFKELGIKFSSVCDTNFEKLVKIECPVYSNLDDLLSNDKSDYVIVATSVDSHYFLAEKIINSSRNVIIEKPISYDYNHIDKLNNLAKEKGVRLLCAYHSAYSLDVDYFLTHRSLIEKDLGKLLGFECDFCDPYLIDGKLVSSARSLHGSYLDSAINALSVVQRLIGLDNAISLTDNKLYVNDLTTSSESHYKIGNVSGVIRTSWEKGVNFKATKIIYENGTVYLNHSMQNIEKNFNGNVTTIDCNSSKKERLLNQYVSMIKAITCESLELALNIQIYKLLLD